MCTQNIIRKNKSNIFISFFNSIVDQLKKREKNAMKREFISDLNEQRESLAAAVIKLEYAKINNDIVKIPSLERNVCSINNKITKNCEIFKAFFSYHPRQDKDLI